VQAGVWHFGQDTGTGKAMATKLMRAAVVPPRLLFLTARQPLDAYVAKDASRRSYRSRTARTLLLWEPRGWPCY